jgi:hypothetical protein
MDKDPKEGNPMSYRPFIVLLSAVALTACQGPQGEAGAPGANGELGGQGDQGTDGQNGTDGQDLAAPEAAIASVAPNALLAGRTTTMRIVGYFTQWGDSTTVRITDNDDADLVGVEVTTVVVSPVGLVVTATVAEDTALGNVKLHIVTGDNMLQYAPAGAEVVVAATATAAQSEWRAADDFETLVETAEFMAAPTVDAENCLGVRNVTIARYSQHKFRLTGNVHAAATTGECSIKLVQDADTDDVWMSAFNATITAPSVTTFTDGRATGELSTERGFSIIAVPVEAGKVLSVRHAVNDNNNLDGTGPSIGAWVEGNLDAIATTDGQSGWLEVASVEAREILLIVASGNVPEEGITYVLTMLAPTDMVALQAGALQGQRLPANTNGANEEGRASWYSISNEGNAWATLTLGVTDENVLQGRMAVMQNDVLLGAGASGWSGLIEAGSAVVRVWDTETDANDGVLEFALEYNANTINAVDENGAGSGTLQTDATDLYLVETAENSVTSLTVTSETDVTISATWVGQNEAIATGTGMIEVPAVAAGSLIFRLSATGDLGDGAAYSVQINSAEAAAFDMQAGATGSAPESGSAWFLATIEQGQGAISTLTVTAGTAEHLQSNLALYSPTGAPIISGETEVVALTLESFFIAVRDTTFVAEQDQSFTLAISANNNPIDVACYSTPNMDVGETERGVFQISGNTRLAGDAYNPPSAADEVLAITLENPATIDMYTTATWDTMLYVHPSCGQDWGNRMAYNDDGRNWDGQVGGPNRWTSAINGLELPAGTSYIIVTAYSRTANGAYTLHYRLRD